MHILTFENCARCRKQVAGLFLHAEQHGLPLPARIRYEKEDLADGDCFHRGGSG